MRACVLASLALSTSAIDVNAKASHPLTDTVDSIIAHKKHQRKASRAHMEMIPMFSYKNDCWKRLPKASAFLQVAKNPGAGMDPDSIEPFVTVEKDGFFQVGCLKDAMYTQGDKHGNNKFDYKMGDVANTSIIHYKEMVAKEDREEMTHKVCFEFCRTVPDMGFFGLNGGVDCYCTPYFKKIASDSSECDQTCPGDSTLMCGGLKKSDIFEMHSCDDTEVQLEAAEENLNAAIETLQESFDLLKDVSEKGEADANTVQDAMGGAGDPDASNLCQEAKIYSGELVHLGEDASELLDDAEEKTKEVGDLKGKNFKKVENAKKAEKATAEMNEALTAVEDMQEKVEAALADAHPEESDSDKDRGLQYVSVMTFAEDSKFTDVPSTCTGDLLQIVAGKDVDGCAAKCDDMVGKGCLAFQYFGEGDGLCFMFKNVEKAQYWTGCGGKDDFLQVKGAKTTDATFAAKCLVKSSNFQGLDLNPDKSGKNEFALKELTKADRCF